MQILPFLRKFLTLSTLALTLLALGGCALFQPRDCETDEIPEEIFPLAAEQQTLPR